MTGIIVPNIKFYASAVARFKITVPGVPLGHFFLIQQKARLFLHKKIKTHLGFKTQPSFGQNSEDLIPLTVLKEIG